MLRRVIAFAAVLMAGQYSSVPRIPRVPRRYAYRTITKVKNEWAVRDVWRTR